MAERCVMTVRPSIDSKHEALGAEVEVEGESDEGTGDGVEDRQEEEGEMRAPRIARTPPTPP